MDRLKIDKDDFDRAQANFSEYMEKTTASEREFQRAVDQLELTRYNMNKERTLMLVRIHSVLTPDQRKGLKRSANGMMATARTSPGSPALVSFDGDAIVMSGRNLIASVLFVALAFRHSLAQTKQADKARTDDSPGNRPSNGH